VGSGNSAHEQDDGNDHQTGSGYERDSSETSTDASGDDTAARGDEHQHEGAQYLREPSTPFVCVIVEIANPWCLTWTRRASQDRNGVFDVKGTLAGKARFGDLVVYRLVNHKAPVLICR